MNNREPMRDLISRMAAIDGVDDHYVDRRNDWQAGWNAALDWIKDVYLNELPSAQPKMVRCKDCKHWKQQTNYAGVPLSFGFCESDSMWQSLYGETYEISHIDTDDDFYCGYAERRTDE